MRSQQDAAVVQERGGISAATDHRNALVKNERITGYWRETESENNGREYTKRWRCIIPGESFVSLIMQSTFPSHRAARSTHMHMYPPRSLARPPVLLDSLSSTTPLLGTALDDGWWAILVLDRATARAARLDALDDGVGGGVAIWNLAEDDVAAVEPGGDDGGDEELGAVGVGSGVGHGEHEGLLVGELEVLVGKLLAVDGLAAGAL